MHMVFKFYEQDRPRTPDDIDAIVCAEIPDPDEEPELYDMVSTNLMHGPCGMAMDPNAPCMRNGNCSKGYPYPFQQQITFNGQGYPKYRRRDNGRTVQRRATNGRLFNLDNQWVVPYNKYLTLNTNLTSMLRYVMASPHLSTSINTSIRVTTVHMLKSGRNMSMMRYQTTLTHGTWPQLKQRTGCSSSHWLAIRTISPGCQFTYKIFNASTFGKAKKMKL